MKRVFLGGTTTGTTWRQDLIKRLISRGVRPEQIINPHLPPGVHWTPAHMEVERRYKNNPDTIVLILICPAVPEGPKQGTASGINKSEWLGPTSMFEIGRYAYSQPRRTAVVLQSELFAKSGRPRKVLEGLAKELHDDFKGKPPYFSSCRTAEDWIVAQLVRD